MTSLTPCSASQRVSPSTSEGRREMKEPRKDGMAQKEQRRSQPEASFTEATGLVSSRRRSGARGPEAGATPSGQVVGRAAVARAPAAACAWPGSATASAPCRCGRADRQQLAAVARGVRGVDAAGEDGLQAVGDVGVVVEAEHAVGLGQRLGELLAVPLGHAADGHHGLGPAVILEVVGLQQGVDGVLLGGLDEATGVDDGDIRVGGVLDELPAVRRQAACELLRVHLVTGAAKSDKSDGTAFGHGLRLLCPGRPRRAAVPPRGPGARSRVPCVARAGVSPPRGRPWCSVSRSTWPGRRLVLDLLAVDEELDRPGVAEDQVDLARCP